MIEQGVDGDVWVRELSASFIDEIVAALDAELLYGILHHVERLQAYFSRFISKALRGVCGPLGTLTTT